jgi:transcriptional regulator GlxA family with amidase domain
MKSPGRPRNTGSKVSAARLTAVKVVEAHLLTRQETSVPMTELCRLVGLSERTLRNAFYQVHGVSTKRWLKAERLRAVHTALSAASGGATVTGVATGFGFYELGRFAGIYKAAFGEAPSATLRARGATGHISGPSDERAQACLHAAQPL